MKKIVVIYNARSGGLGNRVRASLGARNLARATGRRLFVVWPTTRQFEPRFEDLWEGRLGTPMPLTVSQALSKLFPFRDHQLSTINDDSGALVWQIRTGAILELPEGVRSWEDDLRDLVPVPELADRIRRHHALLGNEPYVGVQVRSHPVSHDRTREASPPEWYEHRLDEISRQAPGVRFFFSCDVPEVQERFIARYPGSIGLTDKGGYNTLEGVRSAVCDVYLLASAGYVVGPAYSSFVELALRLAGHTIPHENSVEGPHFDPALFTTASDPLRPAVRR